MLGNNAVTTYLKTGERDDIENCCLRAFGPQATIFNVVSFPCFEVRDNHTLQCSISETYIRKRGHEGACGKLFQTGIYLPAKGIGDSAPSRSRLGPGVKEVESLGGRRKTASQPLRSRWHTEADGRTQAEAPTFRSQVLAFSNYSKDHKSMSLEYLNL